MNTGGTPSLSPSPDEPLQHPAPKVSKPKVFSRDPKPQPIALKSGIPYADTRDLDEVQTLFGQVELDTLRRYRVVPLHRYNEHSIEFGITQDTDRSKLPELQEHMPGVQLTFKTISRSGFNYIINRTFYLMFQSEREGNFKIFGEKLAKSPPKQAFQYIAQLAYWLGASDIHIEPQTDHTRIRFRIDGVLHPITDVATESYKVFLSDLQTRAEIKWGSDEPQSGRISYSLMSNESTVESINMRIETIPTFLGEEIVVRIFNDEARHLRITDLGFDEQQIAKLDAVAAHPNGMILTVGPTGSGKTSTLYSLINKQNSPEVKIITLEDPVEYNIPGITQIPVHTEDTELFAGKLRAVMREDPNIVMIGEIRDVDTAKTAMQAALTGHLVLSTFHATNAAAAITRMMDMIGPNPLFASAVRMIIAQRLARRICTACIEETAPTEPQRVFIKAALEKIPSNRRPKVDTGPKTTLKLKHGKGCAVCHGLGYRGRIAIIEMMPITMDIEKMMTSTTQATVQDIEGQAVRNGMVTLLEDGIAKALAGITTVDEIMSLTEA